MLMNTKQISWINSKSVPTLFLFVCLFLSHLLSLSCIQVSEIYTYKMIILVVVHGLTENANTGGAHMKTIDNIRTG